MSIFMLPKAIFMRKSTAAPATVPEASSRGFVSQREWWRRRRGSGGEGGGGVGGDGNGTNVYCEKGTLLWTLTAAPPFHW